MVTSSRRLLANSPQLFPVRLPISYVRLLSTVPESGNMIPTKSAVFVELNEVKQKISDVENSIQAIEATIQGVESQLNVAQRLDDSDPKKAGEVQYLRDEKKRLHDEKMLLRAEKAQLRDKEKQLRDKEAQLRDEKKRLHDEKMKLRDKEAEQFEMNVRTCLLRDCIAS